MDIKLKHLKAILDKMSPADLNQTLAVNRDDIGVSGVVTKIRKAGADLLFTGEDDPCALMTRNALKNDGRYDRDEIKGMPVAIPKGGIYLEF